MCPGDAALPIRTPVRGSHRSGTIEQGHYLEKIVAGNEPVVSGGFGSLVTDAQ